MADETEVLGLLHRLCAQRDKCDAFLRTDSLTAEQRAQALRMRSEVGDLLARVLNLLAKQDTPEANAVLMHVIDTVLAAKRGKVRARTFEGKARLDATFAALDALFGASPKVLQ